MIGARLFVRMFSVTTHQSKAQSASNLSEMVLFGVSQAGNAFFQQQRHQQAADEYSKAIEVKVEDQAFNAVLYCNRAAAYHAMSKYIDAIADCFTASALDASYVRVLQRRADAYVAIGDHTNAAQVTMLTVLHCTRQWHYAVLLTGVVGGASFGC